jgi:hypothetical protein
MDLKKLTAEQIKFIENQAEVFVKHNEKSEEDRKSITDAIVDIYAVFRYDYQYSSFTKSTGVGWIKTQIFLDLDEATVAFDKIQKDMEESPASFEGDPAKESRLYLCKLQKGDLVVSYTGFNPSIIKPVYLGKCSIKSFVKSYK